MTNILLIDLSSIAHPLFHVSASDPDPNATSIKTVERVRALASGQPHVAVCCDAGRSFRRDIEPSYKANRPPSDAALQHQIALAIETLKGDGFPVWAVPGMEADDLIAAAVAWSANGDETPTVQIASADKDLLQLVSDRVSIKSLKDGSLIDDNAVVAKFGVRPDQVRDYLTLVGDASDNVKGAAGIGEKKAAALLAAFGNLDDLYAAIDAGTAPMQPATLKSLTEFRPRLETVRSLIALRTDVALPFEEVFKPRVPADVAVFDGGLSDGDENMGGLREAGDRPAVGEHTAEAVNQRRADPVPSTQGSGAGSAHAGAGADSSRVHAGHSEGRPDGAVDSRNQYAPAPSGPAAQGLAVRDAETLPPPSHDFGRQLEPRSLREASLLASELFKSRLFSAYGTWQGVLSTILAGRELGMQAMASLRAFHIIDGKPTMSADLIRALVLKSPQCEYFRCTRRDNEGATWVTKRKNEEPISLTFTIEDGKLAWSKDEKAWKASGWGKNPADMCVARGGAKLARLVYADVVFNLYAPEEME